MASIPAEAITAAAEAIHGASCEWDLAECAADHVHDRAATEALEAAMPYLRFSTAGRILQLEQLAAGILASYHQASDGYRGRVGQVQIARWRKTLAGDQ